MATTTIARKPFGLPLLQIDEQGRWTSSIPTEGGIDPAKGELLGFSLANAKLKALRVAAAKRLDVPVRKVKVLTLTLPAGWSCPGASECLAFADPLTGKVWDAPSLKFRCFAASAEARPSVRNLIWHNFNLLRRLKTADQFTGLIEASLEAAFVKHHIKPDDYVIVRIHVGGDFFSQAYMLGWSRASAAMAAKRPGKFVSYAYSKSMHHVEKLGPGIASQHFVLTASRGGKFDAIIDKLGLKEAAVVNTIAQAEAEGLEIDHDDSHAVFGDKSFALLIHGTQPKGTDAAKALAALRAEGIDSGYSN